MFYSLSPAVLFFVTIEQLEFDIMIEYTNADEAEGRKAYSVWVQHAESEHKHNHDNTQGRVPSFPILYFTCKPPNTILYFGEHLPEGKILPTVSKWCKRREEWVLHGWPQVYVVVIATTY